MRGLSPAVVSGGHSSSRCAGLSLSWPLLLGAQAPDAQAQQLWLTGPVAPRHVGSSQTRARTCVPCIGRQTLKNCTTREARFIFLNGTFYQNDCRFTYSCKKHYAEIPCILCQVFPSGKFSKTIIQSLTTKMLTLIEFTSLIKFSPLILVLTHVCIKFNAILFFYLYIFK